MTIFSLDRGSAERSFATRPAQVFFVFLRPSSGFLDSRPPNPAAKGLETAAAAAAVATLVAARTGTASCGDCDASASTKAAALPLPSPSIESLLAGAQAGAPSSALPGSPTLSPPLPECPTLTQYGDGTTSALLMVLPLALSPRRVLHVLPPPPLPSL